MRVKEDSEKACLKLNVQKTNIIASNPITSWQIDEETMETVTDFNSLGSKITVNPDCSQKIKIIIIIIIIKFADETGAYYTEWSKPERKTPIQYTKAYIWNLERW